MTASLSPGWVLAGRGWGQAGGREELREGERVGTGRGTEAWGGAERGWGRAGGQRLGEELREGERVGSGRGTEARGGVEGGRDGGFRQGDGG